MEEKAMAGYVFKAAAINAIGGFTLVDLAEEQRERKQDYVEALGIAHRSTVAHPKFSGYFVKESVGSVGGKKLPAGNVEYGWLQALHGEECAGAVQLRPVEPADG